MPEKYVLDCSVALKWFLDDENLTNEADLILDGFLSGDIELVAPPHLPYEFGAALRKAVVKTNRISDEDATNAFKDFLDLNIYIEYQDNAELQAIWILNNKVFANFYDSAYVTLAKRLCCEWLTADESYPSTQPEVTEHIKHLAYFGSTS